jgi:murein DD-endopeptidase MepM/ murein hydrolase activator NlpD
MIQKFIVNQARALAAGLSKLSTAIVTVVETAGGRLHKLLPETRKSNPISKLLRPIFETPSVKRIVGAQLAVMTIVAGAVSMPVTALGVVPTDILTLEERIEVDVKTDSALTYPVPEAIGVSQGYHVFHPGIDIRAPKGSTINPIAKGKVIVVASQVYGYGHRIEVDHGDGVVSLYAHLGKMFVEEGDEVTPETEIAEIGLTGHTTGPHLHLEVREDGRSVNPVNYLVRK